ncbi:uncharacterized protein LOC126901556 isoform X4 [Daktulosphaira vitifoliae]|uniref:uncharacterized protein LOC126901556 isoform X4 n=1 Tax=Daktulosphaira vitifoliae TaxID=58002 RepID=UPI0021A9AF1D|nr:uncharacterized protein LOC126901556 isoform X4 [Daktulosphaira vitifoliae]
MYLVVLVNLFVTLNHKMYNQIVLIIHLFCFVNISIIIIEGADKSLNVYNKEVGDDIFKEFGDNGKMTFEKFLKTMKAFDITVSENILQAAFNDMKSEGQNYITREAFENYGIVNLTKADVNTINNAFKTIKTTNRGKIRKQDLSKYLKERLGHKYTKTVAEKMIKEICPEKNYIIFMDFLKMVLDADPENYK